MAQRAQTFPSRIASGWRAMAPDQRLAAAFAGGLFLTMFLPWYTKDTTAVIKGHLETVTTTLIAWKSFSFVEAAILLVAVGVLVLLFARAEGRAFHLPGGDGLVITVAGAWVALLVFYRLVDNKTGSSSSVAKVDYGVTWGIFVTLLAGVGLSYAGWRIHQAHRPEPPLPGEEPTSAVPPDAARTEVAPRPRRRPPPPDAPMEGQLTFDDH
jgi:hypothetical protein